MDPPQTRLPPPRTALLLVGHGSHLSPDSSAPVYEHAARIRASGLFDEVVEAFWKEEPSLRDALDLLDASEIFVVPLFLAEGYFTRQVLPRELGLPGPLTIRDGRLIHYCRPIGAHPSMATLILRRAREISQLAPRDEAEAALVVIGHGTERNASSADTVYDLLEELRTRSDFGVVAAGFLDEDPRIETVVVKLKSSNVVLVPFFAARGWHTTDSIPLALGLTGSVTSQGDRTLWYAPPVGTLPEIADLILEIVAEARATDEIPSVPTDDAPVRGARAFLFDRLREAGAGGIRVLQVAAIPTDSGYELRHHDDLGSAGDRLLGFSHPRDALEIARTTDGGAYRPLKTANDLRRGWRLGPLTPDDLWEALALLYPAAIVHSWLERENRLGIVDFPAWAERQSAQYAVVRELGAGEVSALVDAVCGSCLRTRLWGIGAASPGPSEGLAPDPTDSVRVPCREPCTWFATRAKDSRSGKD